MKKTFFYFSFLLLILINLPSETLDDAHSALRRKDYTTAVRIYRTIAEESDAAAQFYLGYQYQIGSGVPQDFKEAAKWYLLSAEQGIPGAQSILGRFYEQGQGVLQSYRDAVK